MTTRAVSEALSAFLTEAHAGQGRAGVRLALSLLDAGVPSDQVIVDLLGAAQLEVGKRWERNDWSVADEHLATGVAQKALDAVADSIELPPPSGLVVVACAPATGTRYQRRCSQSSCARTASLCPSWALPRPWSTWRHSWSETAPTPWP